MLVAFLAVPGLCRFLNVTRRRWIATSDVRQQSTLLDVNTHWHDERSLHTGPVVTTYLFAKSERELFLEKRVEERTSTHGVYVGDWLFVFPMCGFSLSLFCNYQHTHIKIPCNQPAITAAPHTQPQGITHTAITSNNPPCRQPPSL